MNGALNYAAGAISIALACIAIYMVVSLFRAADRRAREARRVAALSYWRLTTAESAPNRSVVNSADFPGDTPDERLRAALEWAQMQPSPSPMVRVEKGASRYFDGLRSVNGVRLIGGQS